MEQRRRAETLALHFSGRSARANRAIPFHRPNAIASCLAPRDQPTDSPDALRRRLRSETLGPNPNWEFTARRFAARTVAPAVKIGASQFNQRSKKTWRAREEINPVREQQQHAGEPKKSLI